MLKLNLPGGMTGFQDVVKRGREDEKKRKTGDAVMWQPMGNNWKGEKASGKYSLLSTAGAKTSDRATHCYLAPSEGGWLVGSVLSDFCCQPFDSLSLTVNCTFAISLCWRNVCRRRGAGTEVLLVSEVVLLRITNSCMVSEATADAQYTSLV